MHKITTKETLKIYNSLSKKKEIFIPIIQDHVGIYVCGATVYDKVHLGNCRTFISLDFIVRYLRYLGYKVRYVRNITDVGYLEDETNDRSSNYSNDKITKKALIERIHPMELAQKYTTYFHRLLDKFNALSPNIEPIASGHIIEQIEIIKILIKKGFAYEADGSVYLDLNRYSCVHKYGILSRSYIEKTIILKDRIQKKNTIDFALWKRSDNALIMHWVSPWGDGLPGWHLECTAMKTKYLGDVFDIHAGGIDLKFTHHECDIAQSIVLHGKIPVHYWMHTNTLTFDGKKMSKSMGNMIIPYDILTKYSSDVIRFFILQTHYRGNLSFSNKALASAEKNYSSLLDSFFKFEELSKRNIKESVSTIDIITWIQKCYNAMNDDFNSSRLITHLFEAMHWIQSLIVEDEYLTYSDLRLLENTMKNFFSDVLGFTIKIKKQTSEIEELLKILMELRDRARTENNWVISDKIRKDLLSLGYILHDTENETKVEVI